MGMQTKCGGQHIDTDRMLQTGVIQGPYKHRKPLTLSWSALIRRSLRDWWRRTVLAWWGRHVIDPKVQD